MRLVFTSLASHGHLYPLLPLAVAAREAGHRVTFATGEALLPTVRKAGLEAAPAGIGMREAFTAGREGAAQRPQNMDPSELAPLIGRVMGNDLPRRFFADLQPLLEREKPDLVVAESANPGGALAAMVAGIPVVWHTFGRVSREGFGQSIRQSISAFATELGLPEEAASTGPHIDICPESAQSPDFLGNPGRVPLRPVPWSDPIDLPAGIADRDRGRPLVYLTLGTAMGDADVLREAIAGLATLAADVLVAAGPTVAVDALGEVPANVRIESWVPQADLLPHLDLVVHHGGSGTTLGAFGAGLPQLLLPQGADQFSNAEVVRELGLGDRLIGAEVTAATVAERAGHLLRDDAVRTATRRMAEEVAAMPTPAEIAARLPEFAG
jgi:UDP:flavonoid glycosyltransferase YjiC (YdhE family)